MHGILIADDEKIERDGIQLLIRRLNSTIEIAQAINGAEALELWNTGAFDIVITDIKMPVMNGIELCKRIREKSTATVLIVLSAYGDFEYTQSAIRLKVDEYLLKPLAIDEFNSAFQNAALLSETRKSSENGETQVESQSDYPNYAGYNHDSNPDAQQKRIVKRVKQIVDESYAQNIGLEWAAEKVGLSAGYLSSFFKSSFGKSFTQYLTGVRMEKAQELLIETDMKISEIGPAVGYDNASYFSLQFKKYFGITANQMREMNGRKE